VVKRALVVAAMMVVGCNAPGQASCNADTDCGDAGICSGNLCYYQDDGGTDGGAMGGGVGGGGAGGGTQACTASCSPWEGCTLDADGGHCSELGVQFHWVTPTAGQVFGPDASVTPKVTVTIGDGGPYTKSSMIPYGGDLGSGTMTASGTSGDFVAASATVGFSDGARHAVIGWAGGPDASVDFLVDATPPTVQLIVENAPNRAGWEVDNAMVGAWKKDESALVRVQASEPVTVASSNFTTTGVTSASGCSACPGGQSCGCFAVDLGAQPLKAPRGNIDVILGPVADAVGNMSTSAMNSVPVTRWKWSQQLVASGATGVSPPAVTTTGRIIVASIEGTSGRVLAFEPAGDVAWGALDGGVAVSSGPVIGSQGAYVGAVQGMVSSIIRIDVGSGSTGVPQCLDASSTHFDGTLCLGGSGAGELIFGVRSGFLISTAATCPASAITVSGTPSLVAEEDAGTQNVFLSSTGRGVLSKYNFNGGAWSSMGSTSTFSLFPQGLFVFGGVVGGAGVGGPTVGGAFVTSSAGTLTGLPSQYAPANTDPAGAAAVAAGPAAVFGSTGGAVVKIALDGGSVAPMPADVFDAGSSVDLSLRTPVLGEGGLTYVIGGDQTLRVLSGTPAVEEWTWASGSGGIQGSGGISQLAIDVSRNTGTKICTSPGVLYVAAAQGGEARLYALIVDSRGLDQGAPWPKYQHDNANTGNPATSLSSWSCP
jgi:hypothetical protein